MNSLKEVEFSCGKVSVLDLMPHPLTGVTFDDTIANSARVSLDSYSDDPERNVKLVEYLVKHQHTSPLEMCEVKLLIEAPIVVFWQALRHRKLTFMNINAVSGRYTEYNEAKMLMPVGWRRQSKSNKQGSDGEIEPHRQNEITEMVHDFFLKASWLYKNLLNKGVAREQARLVLPGFALSTKWIVKGDLWNWLQFCRLRMHPTAQQEIRDCAHAVYEILREYAPATVASYDRFIELHDRILDEWNAEP